MGRIVSVDTEAVRGVVVQKVSDQFGEDLAGYVERSMRTDPDSPFVKMIEDAIQARTCLESGDAEGAVKIITTYRQLAESMGIGPMFDALMESLGIPAGIDL